MKTTLFITIVMGLCLVVSIAPAHAAVTSLTSRVASNDTYLDNRAPDAVRQNTDPDNLYVWYNTDSGVEIRPLVKFDVSSFSLPRGGSITSAILKLQVNPGLNTIGWSQNVRVYRVTKEWDEWSATWNSYSNSLSWTAAGGDYDATVQGEYVSPSGGSTNLTTLSIDITPLVQLWVAGTNPNYGMLLAGTVNGLSLAFYSREMTGLVPILEIYYVSPSGTIISMH